MTSAWVQVAAAQQGADEASMRLDRLAEALAGLQREAAFSGDLRARVGALEGRLEAWDAEQEEQEVCMHACLHARMPPFCAVPADRPSCTHPAAEREEEVCPHACMHASGPCAV